ncbi:hypothetical protein ACQ859_12720 [Roseateles chitinivorans]|uniref:hypothetical protein n=1 Tax=Roseateles chitinivorans TaxID=2917965 RepID=UPI003D675854
MSRNGVRVVDLTARLGGLALQQISAAWSRDAVRQAVSLGDLSGVPVIDWVRPRFPMTTSRHPAVPSR